MDARPVILKPYGSAEREMQAFADMAEVRNTPCHSEDELVAAVADVDLLYGDVDIQITRRVIEAAKRLRGIMACSIGVDYVDLKAATDHGIYVANLPDYCTNAVAEFAVGLMFTLSRHIARGAKFVREDNWDGRRLLRGVELLGKRLGLIGFGKIGQMVGAKGAGLGMDVVYFDPVVGDKSPVPSCHASATFDELLETSDFISIHAPLTAGTRGLIGESQLRRMKSSAWLVNVSRGGIVDEDDLLRALRAQEIAGAALDVLVVEPMAGRHPLLDLDNVLITPHMAWNTAEAKQNAEFSIVEQVRQMLAGQRPTHLVNKEVVGN